MCCSNDKTKCNVFLQLFRKEKFTDDLLPPEGIQFEVRVETDLSQVFKLFNKALNVYKEEKKGPTLLAIQSTMELQILQNGIGSFGDFPQTQIFVKVSILYF